MKRQQNCSFIEAAHRMERVLRFSPGKHVFLCWHTNSEQDICLQYQNMSFHVAFYQALICILSSMLISFCFGRKASFAG